MSKYTSVWEFVRPSDKLIDWTSYFNEFRKNDKLDEAVNFYNLAYVAPATGPENTVECCICMFRKQMYGTIGFAHIRCSPTSKRMFYITLSYEYWRTMKKMFPADVFERELHDTMAHEYAHILTYTGERDIWGHTDPWRRLAKRMGDNGARCIGDDTGKNKHFVTGTNILWHTVNLAVDNIAKADKLAKQNQQIADAHARYSK